MGKCSMGVDMNYKVTEDILNSIQPVCDLSNVSVSTENEDWRGRTNKSDFVTINERHNIGFEVFDNEIIVFYFTNHDHFDYDSSMTENYEEYAANVIDFLNRIFTLPILYVKVTKGKSVKREEYFFVMPDGQEESLAGPNFHYLFSLNPFAKKTTTRTTWQYDRAAGDFINAVQKHIDPDTIYSDIVNDNVYFEIFERCDVFTYIIMRKEYDDYNGVFYWVAFNDGTKSMFDSKEKAIEAVKTQINLNLDLL